MKKIFALLLLAIATTSATAWAEPRTLTLEETVSLALQTDPLIEQARTDRDRGRLGTLRAQLDRITFKIDGQLQELWNKVNIGGTPLPGACTIAGVVVPTDQGTCNVQGGTFVPTPDQGAQGLLNLAASLNVPLFAGFRVDATVKQAQRSEEAAIVQVRRQSRDTALAATRAFWSVRRLELLRDVQHALLDRLKDSETVAGGRVKAGLAPPIDRNRAIVRRLTQASTLADYDGQILDAKSQLGVSLGLKGEFRLLGNFTFPDGPPPTPEVLIATAHQGRPEIAVARLNYQAQQQAVRIAKSSYYPQFGVFGLFQYGNNQISVGTGARDISSLANPFSGLTGSLTLGGSLSMNFFDTLHSYTNTRDAQYVEARLIAEQRRTERAIDADVLAAHSKVTRLFSRRAALAEARDLARDNAKILESRYKSGDALVIEFLDAQLELGQAEATLVDLESQLELAWIELHASLGEMPGRP